MARGTAGTVWLFLQIAMALAALVLSAWFESLVPVIAVLGTFALLLVVAVWLGAGPLQAPALIVFLGLAVYLAQFLPQTPGPGLRAYEAVPGLALALVGAAAGIRAAWKRRAVT